MVGLEAVNLELVVLGDADLLQEHAHIVPLVALQLDDLAVLGVLDHGAVAGEVLLEGAHELLLVELLADALHGRQRLAAIALLDADVDQARAQVQVGGA